MSETPWLSVLMPIHEGEAHLPATLDSIVAEHPAGIELIALDSSPHQRCAAIVDRYADRLPIRYHHMPECGPWTAKTNRAAAMARAPHLSMLHQDDLWRPGRVADLRRAIAANPDAALLLNASHIVDDRGQSLGLWRCPLAPGRALDWGEVADRLLVQNFIAIPAPVIRRADWLAVGGMDEALWYTADWDLYLKLARRGPVAYRNAATTAFRIHGGSQTVAGSANGDDFADQMTRVIDRHAGFVPAPLRRGARRRAATSTRINCALAATLAGRPGALPGAIASLLALGPRGAWRYLTDSRILERSLPRLRARFAGSF